MQLKRTRKDIIADAKALLDQSAEEEYFDTGEAITVIENLIGAIELNNKGVDLLFGDSTEADTIMTVMAAIEGWVIEVNGMDIMVTKVGGVGELGYVGIEGYRGIARGVRVATSQMSMRCKFDGAWSGCNFTSCIYG